MTEKMTGLENLVELRSLALLEDLVKARSRKGAAEALGVDRRTLAASVDNGKLTSQMREAIDRALLLGDAALIAKEERFAGLERRLEALEGEVRAVGEMSSRVDGVDGTVGKAAYRISGVEERLGDMEASRRFTVRRRRWWRHGDGSGGAHPVTKDRPVQVEERMLELETALTDEFKLTLPSEAYP